MAEGYHYCRLPENAITKQFGLAIIWCYEDDMGLLFVENGEYENQVNFCHF